MKRNLRDKTARSPRRLLALFLLLTLVPSLALLYMGWRFAEQDQALSHQRLGVRQNQALDLVVPVLQQKLASVYQQMGMPASWPILRANGSHLIVLGTRRPLTEASA